MSWEFLEKFVANLIWLRFELQIGRAGGNVEQSLLGM